VADLKKVFKETQPAQSVSTHHFIVIPVRRIETLIHSTDSDFFGRVGISYESHRSSNNLGD
jgi:hypothetical protein